MTTTPPPATPADALRWAAERAEGLLLSTVSVRGLRRWADELDAAPADQPETELTMAEPTIHRYQVPVDDQWYTLSLSGAVLHVAARDPAVVELWALVGIELPRWWEFRVFSTGQPLPAWCGEHVGTTLADGGRFVWHLFRREGHHG
jgi:hypothetical protein